MPTLYTLLGIDYTASAEEITRAYRQQVRLHHPDLHRGDAAADERLKAINAARETLLDPARRSAYDNSIGVVATVLATRRSGYDVVYRIAISSTEARMGCVRSLQFHGPDGLPYVVAIPIAPGTASGTRVRVAGAGGPSPCGSARGDLYAVVVVEG